jgi:hypothetical protein
MNVTDLHEQLKGNTMFSSAVIPVKRLDLDLAKPVFKERFTLGVDKIYGMGYLHNTALFIEHHWRTRVTHNPPTGKFDRPFYDMLVGVIVTIDGRLVDDLLPRPESIPQCTTTLRSHEAASVWIVIPFVLVGDPNDPILGVIDMYRELSLSFLRACAALSVGEHTVVVDIVFGCKKEARFCSEFISRGSFKLDVKNESRVLVEAQFRTLQGLIAAEISPVVVCNPPTGPCVFCGAPLRFYCTVCGANICGSPKCVWCKFSGYPHGCSTHTAIKA